MSRRDPDNRGFEQRREYDLRGLNLDCEYEAQVQAKNKFGWSERSDSLRFRTFIETTPGRRRNDLLAATSASPDAEKEAEPKLKSKKNRRKKKSKFEANAQIEIEGPLTTTDSAAGGFIQHSLLVPLFVVGLLLMQVPEI